MARPIEEPQNIGTVLANLDPVGEELDSDSHLSDVNAIDGGLGAIHFDFELDTRQRAGVIDVSNILYIAIEMLDDFSNRRFDDGSIV